MTIPVAPVTEAQKNTETTTENGNEGTTKKNEFKGFDFDEIIWDVGNKSFHSKSVTEAISLLAFKINILKKGIQNFHPNAFKDEEEQASEEARKTLLEKFEDARNDKQASRIQIASSISAFIFVLIWFTMFVFMEWDLILFRKNYSNFNQTFITLVTMFGMLAFGAYAYENASYAVETREYRRSCIFGIFNLIFLMAYPYLIISGLIPINDFYGDQSMFNLLRIHPIFPSIIMFSLAIFSFLSFDMKSANLKEQKFWTIDRFFKMTVNFQRVQIIWIIMQILSNIEPWRMPVFDTICLVILIVMLCIVGRILWKAKKGIELGQRVNFVPLICFNAVSAIGLFLAIEIFPSLVVGLAIPSLINAILGMIRWKQLGKAPTDIQYNNCNEV